MDDTDKSANISRRQFSERLRACLDRHHVDLSPTSLANAYNRRSPAEPVTTHAVRKWLLGEAMPTHPRILILSKWLCVDAAWLQFGDAAGKAPEPGKTSDKSESLVAEFRRLTDEEQLIVRALVEAIIGARTSPVELAECRAVLDQYDKFGSSTEGNLCRRLT